MVRTNTLVRMSAVAILAAACPVLAADPVAPTTPAPASEPETLLTERGKLLWSDDLAAAPSKDWKVAKGKWEAADGAVRGSELKSDMHGAVMRRMLPLRDAVIQFDFRLDGAKTSSLSLNDAKGHCCRVILRPDGFTVQKDSHDKNVADKAAALEVVKADFKPGEWHTLVVELSGSELLASVDGRLVGFGGHPSLDVEKTNFGFTVAGGSVSFRRLKVWEATPSKGWEAEKARLLEARKSPKTAAAK